MRQFLQVYLNACDLCSDPALPLRVGARLRVSSYGMWGMALLCMPTLRQTLDFALRHFALTGPLTSMTWQIVGSSLVLKFKPSPVLKDFPAQARLSRFLLDLHAAVLSTTMADIMGDACTPCAIRLSANSPQQPQVYDQILKCPVEFSSSSDEVHYPAYWLERAPQLANPLTAAMMLQTCSQLLKELKHNSGIAAKVVQVLATQPGEGSSIDAVADQLHLTPRTLRRKLDAEGTSFRALQAEVQRSKAIGYLQETSMSSEEIAEALGFADAACFRRAFKRWTSKSPGAYRSDGS